jgi:hypothetical protein
MTGLSGAHLPSQLLQEKHKLEHHSLDQSGYKGRPILKVSKAKRAGGVVQVIEHMPTSTRALSSIPGTAKKNPKL